MLIKFSGTDVNTGEFVSVIVNPRTDELHTEIYDDWIRVKVNDEYYNISNSDLSIR